MVVHVSMYKCPLGSSVAVRGSQILKRGWKFSTGLIQLNDFNLLHAPLVDTSFLFLTTTMLLLLSSRTPLTFCTRVASSESTELLTA